MRLSTFALWSTALVVAGSAAIADGDEKKIPNFFEAHEIGYIDLNSPQELGGWLSTIPASSPMWSTVPRNDGRNDGRSEAERAATVAANPLDGRASAPVAGPTTFSPRPQQPSVSNPQTTARVANNPSQGGGDSSAPPTRRTPGTQETPAQPTTTAPQLPDQPTNRTIAGDGIPRNRFPGWGGCDPLIHFYADSAVTVNVKAGFHDGLPVAWWPRGIANGEQVEFRDVRVDPRLDPVSSQSLDTQRWPGLKPLSYLRDAMATPVKLGNQVEGGISYEGVMRIAPDLTVRMAVKGVYEIRNDSDMDLVDTVLIPFGETHNGVVLGTIAPGAVMHVQMKDAELEPLTAIMATQLAKSGLFPAEIAALQQMILTPEFRLNAGARLLSRFSDEEWAKRFPLEIAPAPKRVIRVGLLRIFDAQLYNAAGEREGNGRPAPTAKLTGHGRR